MKARTIAPAFILIALIVGLTGCARHYSPDAVSDPYGFFSGIWHGFIIAIAIAAAVNVLSWLLALAGISFLDSVQIIGQPNTGFGYWAGLMIGICALCGSSAGQ